MLIEFGGLPATGKSTLAKRLADELAAVHLRIDEIEDAVVRSSDATDAGASGYAVAWVVAANQLRRGLSVVVDAVSAEEIARDGWRSLAQETGARHVVVETVCSDVDEHRRRAQSRPEDPPGHTHPTWDAIRGRRYQPRTDERLVVDTVRPLDECAAAISDYVAAAG